MPTIFRVGRYRVIIFFNDHAPPHVHCKGGGFTVVINILTLEVMSDDGANRKDVAKLKRAITSERQNLLDYWETIHGDEKED